MEQTMKTLKSFWAYFTKEKGYSSILTIIPFFLVVVSLLIALTTYSVMSIGISAGDLQLLETYVETVNVDMLLEVLTPDILEKLAYYTFLLGLIFIILMLAINNCYYQIIKNHVITKKSVKLTSTFKIGFVNNFGSFILKYIGYIFLPSILLSIIIYATPLINYYQLSEMITSIFTFIFNYYFFAKVIGYNQADYILPLSIGVFIGIIRLIPYIGMILGFIISIMAPIIFIFAHLKDQELNSNK